MPLMGDEGRRRWRWIGLALVVFCVFLLILMFFIYTGFPEEGDEGLQWIASAAATIVIVFLYRRISARWL